MKRSGTSTQPVNVSIATERSKTAPLLIGFIPFALVGATVIFNLITLHAETTSVPYLNDGAIHSEMVRVATQQLRAGHLPLTGWFPQLGEGSPQFLHYQSLGAMLTGGIGLLTGPNVAYAWVLYLVLATWPISIFIAIRLLGFDRLSAGFGSMVSPFVISVLGIGYEQQAYFSIGYGLWSQLLAMWMLPLAWGFSWRAMQDRRALLPATIFVSATIAFHFLTGYLAIFGVIVAFVCSTNKLRIRLRNLAELVIAVGLTSAWVIVPLVKFRTWASINEFLQHGPDVNSYGARRVLSWLAMGQLFDAHRWPVLTTTLFLGLIFIMVRARRDPAARNILVLFIVCLLLFFGRTTFGPLFRLLPGGADLFLRRFLMGVQLAGIVIVGVALSSLARALAGHLLWISRRGASGSDPLLVTRRTLGLLLLVLLLAPAVSQTISIDHQENANIAFQQVGDRTDGAAIAPIISLVSREGGRVYAGLPSPSSQIGGWGSALTVGEVPVFKYLTDFDIDEVGYTLRTASLMTDPEFYFNDNVPSEFALFGVRWLIYPLGKQPSVQAQRVMVRGPYVLWELRSASYLQLADTNGSIVADRTNIGAKTAAFVRSGDAAAGHYLTVTFAGKTATQPTVNPEPKTESSPGSVASSHVALSDGSVSATVVAKRQSVLVLKASFDPGWQATIDGRPVATQMVAPAYVGVLVSKGRHSVTLTYRNTSAELTLITIGIATLFALSLLTIYRRQRLRRARRGGPMPITDLPHGPDLSGAMNNPTADPK